MSAYITKVNIIVVIQRPCVARIAGIST